jgi:hypothetical protein
MHKMMLSGLLAGTAIRLTPAESRAGRLLRAPEGHGEAPAPVAAPAAVQEPTEAPGGPAPGAGGTDAAYEAEFGVSCSPARVLTKELRRRANSPKALRNRACLNPSLRTTSRTLLLCSRQRRSAPTASRKSSARPRRQGTSQGRRQARNLGGVGPSAQADDYEFGEADSRFIADFARWNARQEFRAERAREALTSELNSIEDGWKTAAGAEDITAEYPDFDEVVTQARRRRPGNARR